MECAILCFSPEFEEVLSHFGTISSSMVLKMFDNNLCYRHFFLLYLTVLTVKRPREFFRQNIWSFEVIKMTLAVPGTQVKNISFHLIWLTSSLIIYAKWIMQINFRATLLKVCNLHFSIFLDNGVMITPKRRILSFIFTVLTLKKSLLIRN